ncbi:uncharacterized protein LOC111331401 [Stylophora pistillata]|uniref:uncharacterized protein LOC111331401 n=1 Tax=Stylophora pistillata TaxID=50429 RepID=UPI000C052CB7|nr:uncharacterized protein LOC111331401 [Stylophora pistillata]
MAVWDKKVLFATALIFCALLVLLHKHFKCNLASVVDKLCSAYEVGHVSGPLCPDLCGSQSTFHLGNCLSTVPDKKIYNGEWQGKKIIFKINMSWFEEFERSQRIADISVVSSYQEDVSSRFDFAYSLLDATLDVSTSPYGLTQLCDVHLGNYGITTTSTVKLLDLDLMYPHVFLRTLLEQKKCVSDWDCFVGHSDCWSTCDKTKGICKSLLGIQDLHMVCEGVFPQLFKNPNYLNPTGHNMTCLERAMRKLFVFCSKIPVVYSREELRRNILAVKKRLKAVDIMVANEC